MGRIRTVKPEFWTSEDVAELSWDARLVWIGLWTYVDDNGVGRDNIRLIVGQLFPLETDPAATLARVSRAIDELSDKGRITRYRVGERQLLAIEGWAHQKIDRPSRARYPRPEHVGQSPVNPGPAGPDGPILDEPSRTAREDRASPRGSLGDGAGIREQVPGNREQGSREQGNRDQGSLAPTSGAGEALQLVEPPPGRPAKRSAKLPDGVQTLTQRTQRKSDELWDAVIAVCRTDASAFSPAERGIANRAVKELRDMGVTPEQVRARARRWREVYPKAKLTPRGLTANWGSLAPNAAEARHTSTGGW